MSRYSKSQMVTRRNLVINVRNCLHINKNSTLKNLFVFQQQPILTLCSMIVAFGFQNWESRAIIQPENVIWILYVQTRNSEERAQEKFYQTWLKQTPRKGDARYMYMLLCFNWQYVLDDKLSTNIDSTQFVWMRLCLYPSGYLSVGSYN